MENPKPQIGLNPNIFYATGFSIFFNEEEFAMMAISGNQATRFTLSPKHAKRLMLLLSERVKEYEEKYGELKTSLPPKHEKTQSETSGIGFQGTEAKTDAN